jgi:hypothetical protein
MLQRGAARGVHNHADAAAYDNVASKTNRTGSSYPRIHHDLLWPIT